MGVVNGIVLIVLGALCLPSLVAKKNEKAGELLDKIVPYQGWIGMIACLWGVWGIISAVLSLGIIGAWPLQWATNLAASVVNAAGGFILGFGMIQKFALAKAGPSAQEQAVRVRDRLVAMQSKIGIFAILVGVWVVLYALVLRSVLRI